MRWLKEWCLSFHCPLCDHCTSLLKQAATSQLLLQAHYQSQRWFIIKFRLQTPSLCLSLAPMPYWALIQGTGAPTRGWLWARVSHSLKTIEEEEERRCRAAACQPSALSDWPRWEWLGGAGVCPSKETRGGRLHSWCKYQQDVSNFAQRV